MYTITLFAVIGWAIQALATDAVVTRRDSSDTEIYSSPQGLHSLEGKYQELQGKLEITEARYVSALESSRIAIEAVRESNDALRFYMQILLALMAIALAFPVIYIIGGIERRIRHRVDQRYEKVEDRILRAIEAIVFDNKSAFDTAEIDFQMGIKNFQQGQKDAALTHIYRGLCASDKLKWVFDPRKPRFGSVLEWERKMQDDKEFWQKYKKLWDS